MATFWTFVTPSQTCTQWRSEAKCFPWQTIKVPPLSTSQTFLQIIKMKEDQISCLFIDIRIKHLEDHNQTLTNWNGSCFSLSITSLTFFCLSPASSLLLFLIFLLSLLMHIWTQHVSSNVLPFWFLVSPGKLTAGLSIVYSFRGSHENIKGCVGGKPSVICRCKHFSMFCVVRPVTRGSAGGRIPPSRKFLSPPGKMYWTWIKITGHSSKILGPCQKTFWPSWWSKLVTGLRVVLLLTT